MNIDPTGLEVDVKPLLEEGSQKYKSAQSSLSSVSLPSNFQSGVSLKSTIETCIDEILGVTNSLVSEIENYIEALKEANAQASSTVDGMGTYSSFADLGSSDGETSFWDSLVATGGKLINGGLNIIEGIFDNSVNAVTTILGEGYYNIVAAASTILGLPEGAVNAAKTRETLKESAETATNIDLFSRDTLETTGATLVNMGSGALRGFAKFAEGLIDGMVMMEEMKREAENLYNAPISALIMNNPDVITTAMQQNENSMKSVMSGVKVDVTSAAFDELHRLSFMQEINEISVVKYNDTVYLIIEGVAYEISASITDTIMPGTGVFAKGIASSAKTTEDLLSRMNMTSRNGLMEEANLGKVPQEYLEGCQAIWEMSDMEYYSNVELLYMTGQMTEEKYLKYESIRNMSEESELLTGENIGKAIIGGIGIGISEGTQEGLGEALAKIGKSTALNSSIRAFGNAGVNMTDSPFRSWVYSNVLGTSYTEEFENNGGLAGVGIAGVIGAVSSVPRDALQWYRSAKKDTMISMLAARIADNASDTPVDLGDAKVKIPETYELMKKFAENNPSLGIKLQELDEAFESISILSREEFAAYCRDNKLGSALGVNSDELGILLPPEVTKKTVAHEVLHSLGEILELDGTSKNAFGSKTRAINEAYTEWMAKVITNDFSNNDGCSYNINVKYLIKLNDKMAELGLPAIGSQYFNNVTDRYTLQNNLRGLTGSDKAYELLVEKMDIIDGGADNKLTRDWLDKKGEKPQIEKNKANDYINNFITTLGEDGVTYD